MLSSTLNIRKSINKAFLKVKPDRSQIEYFKSNLISYLDQIKESESEEFHKNIISEFLKNTYYSQDHYINTKGRTDLVIHNGKDSKSSVGVLIETKNPTNKTEMPTKENLNEKAFHELVLYYFQERISSNNLEIRHLIATNNYEWFIFDANEFEKLFAKNKKLVKQFTDFEEGRLSGKTTDFFYNNIIAPFIDQSDSQISYTYFDLRNLKSTLASEDISSIIPLYKIFSPEHLLKLPFINDSNTLDRSFYNELLHIIGLEEIKDKSKKIIRRKIGEARNSGSLIENAISILNYEDCLSQIKNLGDYGENKEDQLYNVALELVITWINRILFVKLLEGQLLRYHNGDHNFKFLDFKTIPNYDELNKLFFHVLAVKAAERNEIVKKKYSNIPYLNSSLFEPNDLEHKTIRISNLEDDYDIPILRSTVLKDNTGKRIKGNRRALQYLFEFLDAFDFSSEGSEGIQEENKPLINASVLGLIFEKINGYKDGSFFTPGFITMYMCRETIRRAVVQKFNEIKEFKCESIDDLYNHIEDIKEANEIINSLKICDPAVGSGHFLVSALNEIIAIKSELKILSDMKGKRLKEYHIEVVNDELVITDEDGEFFEYHPRNPESQRIQETLFHEKQTIIENCLFGVDINQNSVKICRLRLWIELLKNSYYKPESGFTQLETLPNIDINIKCGNSLISRYPLDADIKTALARSKWSIDSYRLAVMTYRNAENKEQKAEMRRLIDEIKSDFESEVSKSDKRFLRLNKFKGELSNLTDQNSLFELSQKEKSMWEKKVIKVTSDIAKIETELEDIRNNKIYEQAFEWRFEFPEILNDYGDFVGFDVVIGNPPYISISKINALNNYLVKSAFETYIHGTDIYCIFFERGGQILKDQGVLSFITSNSWLKSIYGKPLKAYFTKNLHPLKILNIEDTQVFEEATVESCITLLKKIKIKDPSLVCNLSNDYVFGLPLHEYFSNHSFLLDLRAEQDWIISNPEESRLKAKMEHNNKLLKHFDVNINFGIKTGFNSAFIIDNKTRNKLIQEYPKNKDLIKPLLRGRDISKYKYVFSDYWILCLFPSKNIDIEDYKTIKNYLLDIGIERLKQDGEKGSRKKTNNKWYETQDSISYWKDFKKPKIIWGEISDRPKFAFDDKQYYAEATTFILTGEKLKYLLAIFNSKLSEWYFNQISTTTGMGTNRWKKYKIQLLPIKEPSKIEEDFITKIVDKIISEKDSDPNSDTQNLEETINQHIYNLYGLSEDEIRIIEESLK